LDYQFYLMVKYLRRVYKNSLKERATLGVVVLPYNPNTQSYRIESLTPRLLSETSKKQAKNVCI
jgi:hypothetical protein